jgi:hypothetical protein
MCGGAQVRYKDLKDHIKNMHKSKYEREMQARRNKTLTDECAICLEPLGPASDVTTTACKHSFHTFCLVETLGNGMCTSCPLCRTEVEKLVPGGLDGQSLKLIAKLRINIDAAQWCGGHIRLFVGVGSVERISDGKPDGNI